MGNLITKDTRCLMCKKNIDYNGIICIKCKSFYDIDCIKSYNKIELEVEEVEVTPNTKCPYCKITNMLFYCNNDGNVSYLKNRPIKF